MNLPEKGWKGYGRPGFEPFGLRVRVLDPRCAFPNADGLRRFEAAWKWTEAQIAAGGDEGTRQFYLREIGEAYRG